MSKGYLLLETGEEFEGNWIGAKQEVSGEVVFNTSMTGYQEMITDPSYAGQILTFSYPIIGSYGINDSDAESEKVAVSAVIISDYCDEPSHYQATTTFGEALSNTNIPGLKDVDTRHLVSVIRKYKTVRGKIVSAEHRDGSSLKWGEKDSLELAKHVAVKTKETFGDSPYHVVLVDFGYKKSILKALLANGCRVTIVPFHTSIETIESMQPNGVVLSNGPGDPSALISYLPMIKQLTETYPTLGICLGHQLIALAYGGRTKKMDFGHRGGNHPVKDLLTGKVSMTAQNHGYVVEESSIPPSEFQVVFRHVNDRSLEGMKHKQLPVQSVQFHPEAHAGPSDTAYIFEDFIHQVKSATKKGVPAYAKA